MSKKIEALEKRLKALKSKEQDLLNELKRSANIEKAKRAKLEKQLLIFLGEYYLDSVVASDVLSNLEAKGITSENFDVELLNPYALADKCLNDVYSFYLNDSIRKGKAIEKTIQNAKSKQAELKEIFVQRVKKAVEKEMSKEEWIEEDTSKKGWIEEDTSKEEWTPPF